MFGPGTLGFAKWVGEIDDADRLPEYVARAFHTAMQGRPGPGGAGAARGHADDGRPRAPVLPRVEPALAWPAPGRAARACASCCWRRERPFVIAGGSGWDARGVRRRCSASPRAGSCRWAARSASRTCSTTAIRNYAGDVGIGINPKLAARVARGRPGPRDRPAPGRDDDRRLHAARSRRGRRRSWSTSTPAPRSSAASTPPTCCSTRRWPAAAQALETLDAPADAALGARGPRRRTPTTRPTSSPTPVAPLDMAEVVQDDRSASPGRQRSSPTAPATSAAGCTASTATRACSHGGRTQLAPTSGAMGYGVPAAVAAALAVPDRTVDQPRRRRRLPDDRPGAGDGDRSTARKRHRSCIVVDNGSYGTIRMHQEREYPGACQRHATWATPTSPRWRGPTAGRAASASSHDARSSSRRCAPRSRPARAGADRTCKLDAEVITSRTTLAAIRAQRATARLKGRDDLEQAVEAARVDRHHRRLAHLRLGVVGDRQAGRAHHRQVVGAVADGDRLRRRDAERARRSRAACGASRRRRRCRPRAGRPCGR